VSFVEEEGGEENGDNPIIDIATTSTDEEVETEADKHSGNDPIIDVATSSDEVVEVLEDEDGSDEPIADIGTTSTGDVDETEEDGTAIQGGQIVPPNNILAPCKRLLVSACFDTNSCPRDDSERSGEYDLYEGPCGIRAKEGFPVYCKPGNRACGLPDANYLYVSVVDLEDGQLTWHLQDEGACGEDSPVSVLYSTGTGIESADDTIECTCTSNGDAAISRKDLQFATTCLDSAANHLCSWLACLTVCMSVLFAQVLL